MFCVDKKLKLTISILLLLSFALTTPALAGAIIGNTIIISADTPREVSPAIAYNSTNEEYLVVWYNDRAGNDDIRAQRLDKNGAKLGPAFYVSWGDGHEKRFPDVAYNSKWNQYLVVWENLDSNTQLRSIRARRVNGWGVLMDNADIVLAGDSGSFTPTKPAVAYASTADRYMVVWADSLIAIDPYKIYAQKVKQDGALEGIKFIVSEGTTQRYDPDIAYNRHANRHLVVWEQFDSVRSVYDVEGRQVHGDGGTFGTAFNIGWYTTTDSTNPSVAAIPNSPGNIKFMVVFQCFSSPGNHQIAGKFINEDGTIAHMVYPALESNDETVPAVAGSEGAQEYLVLWREDAGVMDKPIKARQYTSAGADLSVTHELSGPATDNPAVASGPLGDFLIAYQDTPISSTNEHIFGSLFGYRSYVPLAIH